MNHKFLLGFFHCLGVGTSAQNMNSMHLFETDWWFYRGGLQGAESVSFDNKGGAG
jgi:hypothetical protein